VAQEPLAAAVRRVRHPMRCRGQPHQVRFGAIGCLRLFGGLTHMLTCTVDVVVHRPPQYKLRHHEGDLKQATYVTWQKGAIDRMYVDG